MVTYTHRSFFAHLKSVCVCDTTTTTNFLWININKCDKFSRSHALSPVESAHFCWTLIRRRKRPEITPNLSTSRIHPFTCKHLFFTRCLCSSSWFPTLSALRLYIQTTSSQFRGQFTFDNNQDISGSNSSMNRTKDNESKSGKYEIRINDVDRLVNMVFIFSSCFLPKTADSFIRNVVELYQTNTILTKANEITIFVHSKIL